MLSVPKAWLSRADMVHVRPNAPRSLLSLSFLGAFVIWIASGVHDDPISKYRVLLLGASPFIATIVAFFQLMRHDPDRLQSEELVLRRTELSIHTPDSGGQTKPLEEPQHKLPNVQETAPPQIATRKEES